MAGAGLVSPRRLLLGLFAVGVGLLAIGAAVFFASFPHGTDDFGWFAYADAPDNADWEMGWPDPSGDLRLTMLGAAIAGAGFLVMLVPIVAWGVHLGRGLGSSRAD